MADLSPLGQEYNERYQLFSKQMYDVWMHHAIQPRLVEIVTEFYSDKDKSDIVFDGTSPINPEKRQPVRIRTENFIRMIGQYRRREVPESVFLTTISLFEAFVGDVARIAWVNDPEEFLIERNQNSGTSTRKQNENLLEILISSPDRQSTIDQYVHDRIKRIFYGNPIDVFTKNTLRFGIESKLSSELESELILYAEMTARRNVIVHNMRRPDKKYRESSKYVTQEKDERGKTTKKKVTHESRFLEKERDEVAISDEYLYTTILTLDTIARQYIHLVAVQTTGEGIPTVRL